MDSNHFWSLADQQEELVSGDGDLVSRDGDLVSRDGPHRDLLQGDSEGDLGQDGDNGIELGRKKMY